MGGEGTGICPDGSNGSAVGACDGVGIALAVEVEVEVEVDAVDSKGK